MPIVVPTPLASLVFALFVLSGCGGGGDGGAGSASPAAPDRDLSARAEPCPVADLATRAVASVNLRRAIAQSCPTGIQPAVGPVQWSEALNRAAEAHAADMASSRFLGHTGSNGSTMVSRVEATGYRWQRLAENLLQNNPTRTLDDTLDGWLASPQGHCENFMLAGVSQMGLACYRPRGQDGPTYWALVLGQPG